VREGNLGFLAFFSADRQNIFEVSRSTLVETSPPFNVEASDAYTVSENGTAIFEQVG
jgi:hypothetical protein